MSAGDRGAIPRARSRGEETAGGMLVVNSQAATASATAACRHFSDRLLFLANFTVLTWHGRQLTAASRFLVGGLQRGGRRWRLTRARTAGCWSAARIGQAIPMLPHTHLPPVGSPARQCRLFDLRYVVAASVPAVFSSHCGSGMQRWRRRRRCPAAAHRRNAGRSAGRRPQSARGSASSPDNAHRPAACATGSIFWASKEGTCRRRLVRMGA